MTTDSMIISYLGKNSYPGIVSQIVEKLSSSQALTIAGNQVLTDMLTTLNESKTPVMDLRQFTTNAEKIAPNDTKLFDIINFVKDTIHGGDLNFLVNMAKEEHFKEMTRAGFPTVEATIKDFESLFSETPSIIEQAIKNGLLDNLQSNLLMDLKSSLIPDGKNKIVKEPDTATNIINENQTLFNNNLIMYSPVAISLEDIKNNRIVLLTESDVISIDRETKEFNKLIKEDLDTLVIPDGHRRMMSAIQELAYNPNEECFSLNEEWDFNLILNKSGQLTILNENSEVVSIIPKNELTQFLMESMNFYEKLAVVPSSYNRNKFQKDADNLIILCENHNKLVKIDTLKTLRNLNENSYVILNINSETNPKIISGTGIKKSQLFESFVQLNESCNDILKQNVTELFENQLEIEKQFTQEKFNQIDLLNQQQKEINQAITDVDNLLKIAEENSPAFNKLNESRISLNEKLEVNLLNLNNYVNNHKLY